MSAAAIGVLADFELRNEFETAGGERREEIIAEMGARSRLRRSVIGHDRSLCDHPVCCVLVGPQRMPGESLGGPCGRSDTCRAHGFPAGCTRREVRRPPSAARRRPGGLPPGFPYGRVRHSRSYGAVPRPALHS